MRRRALVTSLFATATLAMLRPSKEQLTGAVPDNLGDPTLVAWLAAWGAHAVKTDPAGYFSAPNFWPAPNTLAYADALLPLSAVFGPVHAVTGNWAIALNATVLALLLTNALGMYALARWLTGSTAAAVFAGLGFTFSTYFLSHLGNIQMLAAAGLPLGFLLLGKVLAHGRLKDAVGAGLLTTVTVLAAAYYGALWALMAAVMVTGWLLARRAALTRQTLGGVALAGAVALGTTLPFAVPYLELQSDPAFSRPLIERGGVEAADLVTPAAGSWLYADQSQRPAARGHEYRFFPGLVLCAAAVAGTVVLRRQSREQAAPEPPAVDVRSRDLLTPRDARLVTRLIVVAAGAAFTFSLGPNILGHPAPFAVLHAAVPGFSGVRVPARFFAGALVGIALLGAFGLRRGLRRLGPRARLPVTAAACALVLLELVRTNTWAPLPQDDVTLAAYRELAQRPDGAVVELPMADPATDPAYPYVEAPRQLHASVDWHPRVNGYSGYVRPRYLEDVQVLNTFPSAAALERLRALRVRYVLIHGGQGTTTSTYSPDAVRDMLAALGPEASSSLHGQDVLVDLGNQGFLAPAAQPWTAANRSDGHGVPPNRPR